MDQPTIFVNIASYRDSECQWTVKDLFDKALHPERIFVGICWQFVPGEDDDCFEVETRPEQCRITEVHAKDSKGACWARHQTQKLWRGEDYTFQIDSHMRFAENWDQVLLDMLGECPSDQPVLSTYPISYEPPDKLGNDGIITIHAKYFDGHGILMFGSNAVAPVEPPDTPRSSAFCAAGMVFANSRIIKEVPYDPFIYFQGEEISLAARLYTHGWDIFIPNRVVAYHDYTKRPARARHWEDQLDWGKLNNQSMARVRHLLGMESSTDPGVIQDIDIYGLGSIRSLDDYQIFSKVNFAQKTIDGKFSVQSAEAATAKEQRAKVFTAIWEQNGWNCKETRSGHGAAMAQTQTIRKRLPAVFKANGIKILGDAGCGELNWIKTITDDLQLYLGFDIVDGLVQQLHTDFADRTNHFFSRLDIVNQQLPECDAILCRDCLTHLTFEDVRSALQRFVDSGSRYLIATTHPEGTNTDIKTGGWYPMNLEAEPFSLGAPAKLISEDLQGSKKSLGIWDLKKLSL